MKYFQTFFVLIVIVMMIFSPVSVFAQEKGLVPDCGGAKDCTWDDLMNLVNEVINFILFKLALPICAIMFAYAGFLMITSGGESGGAREHAKSIFSGTIIGLLFAAGAFIIVNTVLSILGYDGTWIGFLKGL